MKVSRSAVLVAQLFVVLLMVIGTSGDEFENLCGDNTEPRGCGPPQGCETTCATRYRGLNCLAICTSGCYCRSGYVRESKGGPCILESDCPPLSPPTEPFYPNY